MIDEHIQTLALPNELSHAIQKFLLNANYDTEDFGELLDEFPFGDDLIAFIKSQQWHKTHKSIFDKYIFEIFKLLPNKPFLKHNDSRDGAYYRVIFWFTNEEFTSKDGGKLIFYIVDPQEIKQAPFFNAENYYDFRTIKETRAFIPQNGTGLVFDNRLTNLIHEVTPLSSSKKRISVTIALGYKGQMKNPSLI